MFPGWKTINLRKPTYDGIHAYNGSNSDRWLIPGTSYSAHFNEYVEAYCPEWIGNYKETYFEVNVVMIDENNMDELVNLLHTEAKVI